VIPFTKMQGIGNDFVVLNVLEATPPNLSELSRTLCDRHMGVGADGLILVGSRGAGLATMRMLNPDGSESDMCGNGLRCVAKWLHAIEFAGRDEPLSIETGGRTTEAILLPDGRVRVDMGPARILDASLTVDEWTGFFLDVGNPHFVVFTESVEAVPLETVGPKLERHPAFPNRTNVHFVEVIDEQTICQRTWERGAGITLACGSGACACAVASRVSGRTSAVMTVHLPGGDLEIDASDETRVWMTGPAQVVFTGEFRT